MTVQKVLTEAMKLRPHDRLNVARELLDSVDDADEPEFKITPEFARELERRVKDAEAHPESLRTLEEVETELDALLRKDARKRK